MFIVTRKELKKTKFITQYDSSRLPEIKLDVINQLKTESTSKEKSHTPPPKSSIKKSSSPKNLFSILHNQHQIPIVRSISPPITHIKKKRIINDESGNTIGRWTREEHKKFIEGIIKYGNNWKQIQEYVNTRTSTQARSHAQKFFEKIKKNNTLKSLGTITVNNKNNFTNATIQKLHNTFKNCSQDKINSVVNKFLSLEYGVPKKRKRNIQNNYISNNNNNSTNLLLKKRKKISNKDFVNKYVEYKEYVKENKVNEENNFCENNNNNNNIVKNEIDEKNDNDNISESEYRMVKKDNKNYKLEKINEEINDINKVGYNSNYNNNLNNIYSNNCNNNCVNHNFFNNNYNNYNFNNCTNYNFFTNSNNINDNSCINNFNESDIDYIFSKFVDNLSYDNFNYNKFGKRKNTIESIGGDSLFNDNNINSCNNFNNNQIQQQNNKSKSRKNSFDMNLKEKQNLDISNDYNDILNYKKIFNFEENVSNNRFFENSRKQSVLDDEMQFNFFQSK